MEKKTEPHRHGRRPRKWRWQDEPRTGGCHVSRREEVKRGGENGGLGGFPVWTRSLSVQRSCRGGGQCLVRQWREMNELCLSRVWGLFVNNLGWSEEEHRHLKRNIHQAAMKM